MKSLREKLQHKSGLHSYTLGNRQVGYILRTLRSEMEGMKYGKHDSEPSYNGEHLNLICDFCKYNRVLDDVLRALKYSKHI